MNLKGRVLKSVALALLALPIVASATTPEAVPGEYVVRLKKQAMALESKQALSRQLGAFVKSTIPSQNIIVVKKPVFETVDSAVKTLAQNDLVDIVEPNYIYRINKRPNDPMYLQLWGLSNEGQADSQGAIGVAGVDIEAEKAWDIETGSRNTIIAVIDTGVDYNHPDLKPNLWVNEAEANGKPGIDDDKNGVIDDIHGYNAITDTGNATDDQGHGSHCAGTIGAKGNDGAGIVGVNWDTQIMAVKFLDAGGSGTLEHAIKAIDYANRMGAKILSNSWGGGGFSQTLLDVIENSNKAGAIFIAAAGNDGKNNDMSETFPANYNVPNIVSVAAIDNKANKAFFSNYGKRTVHLGAPGVNIYSSTGGSYGAYSGTSMATPHVSGVAALVWSHEPGLTAMEVKQRLLATVRPIASLKGKSRSGGMVSAYNALTNQIAPPDPNDPANWSTQPLEIASASPYLKNTDETYSINIEGANEFAVYFEKFDTEAKYDTVQIFDSAGTLVQTLSGNNDDMFSFPIKGSSATLVFKSDGSVERLGWKITKAALR